MLQSICMCLAIARKELAQQLCLYDQELFEQITIHEIISKSRDLGINLPNLQNQIRFFNSLTNLAKLLIKNCQKHALKLEVLKNLIDLILDLYQLNNFNSGYAIYLGIKHIIEFEDSEQLNFKKLQWIHQEKFEKLVGIFSNQQLLQEKMDQLNYPAIPFLPSYYKEIFFYESIMKKYEVNKSLVQISKLKQLVKVTKKINNFKKYQYTFEINHEIYNYIKLLPIVSILPK